MRTRERVHEILSDLSGLDGVRDLFSELNYDVAEDDLSRRDWGNAARTALADDPQVIAYHGDFQIIHARLASDRLLLGMERPVVNTLLRNHPYALFVFSNERLSHWHFVNSKYDKDLSKRRLFRRITVGPEERLRTASERMAMLALTDIQEDLFGIPPLVIQERHDEAFDVEQVQKAFFREFAQLYHKVAADIAAVPGLKNEAGKQAQLLLDRMLFLYFIQKKGWLNNNPNYLYERFLDCWKPDPRGDSYYAEELYPLFICLSNADVELKEVGSVPFLNGGLFELEYGKNQRRAISQTRIKIKNSTFKAIFDDLLEKYNFTVTEDTPLDVEVAIDPEMLGKIFESLILQLEKDPDKDLRKLTGSYYTPRPIVHFMCQEALKEYLVTQLAGDAPDKCESARDRIAALLHMPPADHLDEEQAQTIKDLFTPSEAKIFWQAILGCRVCDPAVGSGAFPVGMLHEMVAAIARLDLRISGPGAIKQRNYDYDVKKQIIESCLYGVDIQEQAVRLCELRLWLSLVVDYEIDPDKPFPRAIREVPSLPNLSYHIVRGDSLLERLFGHVVQLDQMARDTKTRKLIESIQADKHAYFLEQNTGEKRRLELKILAKQADLAEHLMEAKQALMKTYQTNLFGEGAMNVKERKAKAEREAQVVELRKLKRNVTKVKIELEQLVRGKRVPVRGNLEALRRKYFHTGEYPTFMWWVDFAEVFQEKKGFDVVIANPPYRDIKGLDPELVDLLFRHFATTTNRINLYACFIVRLFDLS